MALNMGVRSCASKLVSTTESFLSKSAKLLHRWSTIFYAGIPYHEYWFLVDVKLKNFIRRVGAEQQNCCYWYSEDFINLISAEEMPEALNDSVSDRSTVRFQQYHYMSFETNYENSQICLHLYVVSNFVNRSLHSTGAKRMGGGHAHGHDEPFYLHAKHMYNLDRMKNQKLKMSLGVFTAFSIGVAIPVYAVIFQQKKTASA
ncbi:hypothetical protein M9H77_17944 [Catharanthus roseus]|uniref:Uncharacterized protein n=1 Tax=Catharanthus roseus TaxID=4058 RepID=A0ACC0B621_CATRO|nr:hypothetical protein M9H77_17944 [Catharanthus roseus]